MPIQKMRRFLSAAGVFFSSFMATAIAILAVLLLMVKLLGFHLFTIESASMAPRYPVGTLIIVQNVRAEKISAGDVITYVFNEEGTLVTHRVIAADPLNRVFTTQGDANNCPDGLPVLWENVVGKVRFGIPGLGKALGFLTAGENRPFILCALAGLLGISTILEIREYQSRKKRSRRPLEASGGAAEGSEEAPGKS